MVWGLERSRSDARPPRGDDGRFERAGAVRSDGRAPEVVERRVERADAQVAALAGRQHGIADRPQLLAAGLSRDAIAHRQRTGRLHLLHRGVYAVGHAAVSPLGRDLAAVLACGHEAVLGHRSAAALWGLLPRREGPVDVVLGGPRRDGRRGIRVHRTDHLPPADTTRHHGIPVTTPQRTLLDLAATARVNEVERAVAEARVRRLVSEQRLLERAARRRGAQLLRRLLSDPPALTRGEAERRFLLLIRRAGLPRPATNVRIGRWEVDAVWRDQRVVVEVDGYAFHSGRAEFERDRRKDAELQAAGYRVLRITWRQLTERPEAAAASLASLLAAPRPASA